MNTIFSLIAALFFISAVCVGTNLIKAGEGWKSVGITYGLLAVGATLFGIALTL